VSETLTEGQFDFLVGEVERTYAADSPLDDNLVRSVCQEARRLRAEIARLREALTEARDDLRRGMLVDGGDAPSSVVDALYAIDAALNERGQGG
jgi:hypothetical protein